MKNKNSEQEQTQSKVADLVLDIVPKMMQIVREEMRYCRGDRLSVIQFRVLAGINSGITQNKILAERLGMSEAAMSRLLDILIGDNLVKRGINKDDRRQAKLSLTGEGEKLFHHIKKDAHLRLKEKISFLKSKDLNLIVTGLEVLRENMSELQNLKEKE